ncbi:unnamed protein product [Cyclocybe aegerita]|uniref:cellulase n=1 Tax=Cyclocybe aegerita TaxID=1973307 RepID=A0A8S0WXR5_CYCAE|nr:unnamed protein product [Cyclocybe aegerita]
MFFEAIFLLALATVTLSTPTFSAPPASRTCAETLPPPKTASELSYVGVNIAGFDFGCGVDGTCTSAAAWAPLTDLGGHDGAGQMEHFFKNDGFNTFRLPVGWQFLTNDVEGGKLNSTNFAKYDALVKACLGTGASCIIDIHNYARFNNSASFIVIAGFSY